MSDTETSRIVGWLKGVVATLGVWLFWSAVAAIIFLAILSVGSGFRWGFT